MPQQSLYKQRLYILHLHYAAVRKLAVILNVLKIRTPCR